MENEKLKTLKDFDKYTIEHPVFEDDAIIIDDLKAEAVKQLKIKKEINTADWVEFFGIEEEFTNMCLNYNDN